MSEVDVENMSADELAARVAELQAENEQLKTAQVTLEVSAKGCVMVKGLRRFPITLYAEEWETILNMKENILQFISDHPSLSRK